MTFAKGLNLMVDFLFLFLVLLYQACIVSLIMAGNTCHFLLDCGILCLIWPVWLLQHGNDSLLRLSESLWAPDLTEKLDISPFVKRTSAFPILIRLPHLCVVLIGGSKAISPNLAGLFSLIDDGGSLFGKRINVLNGFACKIGLL